MSGRTPVAQLCDDDAGGKLDRGLRCEGRADDGSFGKDALLCRASFDRQRQAAACVAFDGDSRSTVSFADEPQKAAGVTTFCSALPTFVGKWELSLFERLGLHLQALGKPLKLTTEGIVEEDPKPGPKKQPKPPKGGRKGKESAEETS